MPLGRRRFLMGSLGVGSMLPWATTVKANDEPSGEIVFEDQTTDGTYIIVSKITTNIDAMLVVRDEDSEPIYRDHGFEAGEYEEYQIELSPILTESTELSVHLYPEGGGEGFGLDWATVTVADPPELIDGIGPKLIEADPDAGFNFPYFLYAPPARTDHEPRPLLVEPNNSGSPSDDFDVHLENAERVVNGGPGRRIADELPAPFLVPALPRPRGSDVINPQNLWRKYLKGEESELARPDLQVLAMADDARERLNDSDYPVDEDGIMLNGFSQSADWVGLFTALHPEEVRSVSAGGVNGMPILPIEEANGYTLDYHVGVANVEELIDRSIDVDEFANVRQFYYMGELDDSDTLPYFHDSSMAEAAKNVLGRHMIKDRFSYAQSVYEDEDVSAIFRVYENAGHTPRPAYSDLVEFHERSLTDEEIDAIRDDIGGNVPELGPHIEFAPNHPEVGDEITFDARRSAISDGDLEAFEWEVSDETQNGAVITHSFSEVGGHNVVLRASDTDGNSYRTVKQIVVRGDDEESEDQSPDDPEGTVTFSNQTTDGTYIIVDEITTNIDAMLVVRDEDSEPIYRDDGFEAGEYEEYRIELSPILTESAELSVHLYPEGGGSGFGRDVARVTVEDPPEIADGIGPRLIEADSEAGFNYPYFLYAPPTVNKDGLPVMVEPNNTGSTTDDFDEHLEAAERTIDNGVARTIVDALESPLVVPVFPRPRSQPVDWTHYVHALDRETMSIDGGPLERVDLQLLAMVEDARQRLDDEGYPVADEEIMLTGFSASGNFVERFVALHPSEVHSVSAGGLNGMVTLPIADLRSKALEYHIGIANLEDLTGKPFNIDAFRDVPQYLYLGELDVNDTLPYNDAWTGDEWRELALEIYGLDMQAERFPLCRALHDDVGTSAIFRMYEEAGHSSRPALDDLVEFHERVLEDEAVETIRADLGGAVPNARANVQFSPSDPKVGEQVAFHAVDSDVYDAEITDVEWQIGEEHVGDDWTFSTSFETTGVKQVTLKVTTEADETYEASEYIPVKEASSDQSESDDDDEDRGDEDETDQDDEDKGDEDDETDQDDGESTGDADDEDDTIPGFGIAATITAIGGAGYMVKHRLEKSKQND